MNSALTLWIQVFLISACGSWLGNPGKPGDGGQSQPPKGDGTASSASIPGTNTAGDPNVLGPGQVMMQLVNLEAGQQFETSAALEQFELVGDDAEDLEISFTDPNQQERLFERSKQDAFEFNYAAQAAGQHMMWVRNNSLSALRFGSFSQSGYGSLGSLIKSNLRNDAPNKNLHVKAIIAFARQCKDTASDANSTTTVTTAPTGFAFAQPFVFVGTVDDHYKVTPVTDAKISVISGSAIQPVKRLSEMPYRAYREMSGLTEEQHRSYTTIFYQSYFGGAGELYTVDTFRRYGDCSAMIPLPIESDPGKSNIKLKIVIPSLDIDRQDKIRVTAASAFSTYISGNRINDWTQCTYDGITGKPTTYNGSATECKKFSRGSALEIRLDYKLPSAEASSTYSVDSDPTRAIFYGHSKTAQWNEQIRAHAAELRSGASSEISISSCASNGGLIAVPLKTEGTKFPINEFNVANGDVINLARKTGSYTALTEFYQGNIDASGEFDYPTCIPDSSSSCADFKLITVKSQSCVYKADSGITATSIGDSMIYPDYFEISGIVEE